MRYPQCEGCPYLMAQPTAIRELFRSNTPIENGWLRVRWFCSNGGIRPNRNIPYCELANNGKGGLHRLGGK